jgi:hypothetical protein
MLWRAGVILIGGGYVAYRLVLAVRILQAKRAGDVERELRLRRRAFGFFHWAIGILTVFTVLFTLLVWSNSR